MSWIPTASRREAESRSQPKLDPVAQHRRHLVVDEAAHFLGMIARAEVRADDQLVLETVRALDEVIQVHVSELVDLLAAVIGAEVLRRALAGAEGMVIESVAVFGPVRGPLVFIVTLLFPLVRKVMST